MVLISYIFYMRLNRDQKKELAVEHLIDKMFEIAGHDVTFQDIKGREDNWFQEWTMTVEQSEQWKKYGSDYLRKLFRWNKKMADNEMLWFNLQWGLKYSDFGSVSGNKTN